MILNEQGDAILCHKCTSSNIIRSGMSRDKQRYQCKDCRSFFIPKIFKSERSKLARQKAAMLVYLAGANNNDMQELFGVSYPTIKTWIEPLQRAFAKNEDLNEIRRMKETTLKIVRPLDKIPAGKKWLMIELDEDLFNGKSVKLSE